MSKKDMAHSKDRMPREMETCDMTISLSQIDISEWQVVNSFDYSLFYFLWAWWIKKFQLHSLFYKCLNK